MSPRPTPTRHDATAMLFLNAGAHLIDGLLGHAGNPRLAHLHYPAALDWIRIEDVLRLVGQDRPGDLSKSFRNRWPSRDDYLRDCFVHALLYRDSTGEPIHNVEALGVLLSDVDEPLPRRIRHVTTDIINQLIATPRSYMLAHAAPMVANDPGVHEAIAKWVNRDIQRWASFLSTAVASEGVSLRPDWTIEQLTASIQVIVDGVVVRHRLGVPLPSGKAWAAASTASATIVAVLGSVLDLDRGAQSLDQWFTNRLHEGAGH